MFFKLKLDGVLMQTIAKVLIAISFLFTLGYADDIDVNSMIEHFILLDENVEFEKDD